MSLTSDIAALVAATNNLIATFDGKKTGIENALAAALTAVPSPSRTVYLDQIDGLDSNDGLTAAAPVQSLSRAISLGGVGRALDIILMSDYTFVQPRHTLRVDQKVRLQSYNGAHGVIKKKVYLGLHARTDIAVPGDWEVGGFYCPDYGVNTLNLESIEVIFPAAPSAGAMVADSYNGILKGNVNEGPALTGLEINYCTLTRPSGSVGVVAGIRTHFLGLFVKSTTYVSGDFAGKWVANVSSGATPASVGWVCSNLSTL
jgi:hypothetical protein